MSQHASDSPQRNEDESTDRDPAGKPLPSAFAADRAAAAPSADDAAAGTSPITQPEGPEGEGSEEVSATGNLVDPSEPAADHDQADGSAIRVGSPFAVDPFEHNPARTVETFYDVGPLKYTAMGAVSASVMVVGFAAAAAYFFPAGGTAIAALGCVLSIFGMYSSYRFTAAGLLAIHLGLFVLSYSRMLSS